jgi:hypothetical protein
VTRSLVVAESDVADVDVDVAVLLTSELVANAVLYGLAPIRLQLHRQPGTVRIEVHDQGLPFSPPAEATWSLTDERGRGISLLVPSPRPGAANPPRDRRQDLVVRADRRQAGRTLRGPAGARRRTIRDPRSPYALRRHPRPQRPHHSMKIVAWNCLQKFDRNLLHLLDLDPDLAIVSESQPLTTWPMTPTGRTLTQQTKPAFPGSPKHLTVLVAEPWTVHAYPAADTAPPWALPVQVTGPVDFLAVGLCPVQLPVMPAERRALA